jgi:UDP-glucose:(glucosyl)LPS alpha-1,3-glucosyltransferase/UDP-glucose:(galactosyl)LPS alpha-1,2-glucosyltransferase
MRQCVAFSFDMNYYDGACVAVKSFLDNYHGTDVLDVFCLVRPDMMDKRAEFVRDIGNPNNAQIHFAYSQKFFDIVEKPSLNGSLHISSHAWQRLWMGSILDTYDKVIYVDVDTITLRDVQPMLDYPLRNKFLAVLEHSDANFEIFGTYDRPYFNDGVFITDLNYWREIDMEALVVKDIQERGETLYIDQDALNSIIIDHWSPLPISFNTLSWTHQDKIYSKKNCDPIIVHFVSSPKPWQGSDYSESPWVANWHEKFKEVEWNRENESIFESA